MSQNIDLEMFCKLYFKAVPVVVVVVVVSFFHFMRCAALGTFSLSIVGSVGRR